MEKSSPTNGPPLSPDEYNKVVESAKLLAIQIAKSQFNVSVEFYDPDINRRLTFSHEDISTSFDMDSNVVIGKFNFECAAKHKRKKIFYAAAEYLVVYEVHGGADSFSVEQFCGRVGVFAAYPYFRALVAHLAWAANAKLPPLPVIATRGAPIKAIEQSAERISHSKSKK